MAFGVTSSGFNLKRFTDILDSLKSRAGTKSKLLGLSTDAETVFGEILDIMSAEISDMWEMGLAVSQLTNPESVEGVNLDNVGALVGVERQEASPTNTYIKYLSGSIGIVSPTELTTDVEIGVTGTDITYSPAEPYKMEVTKPISQVQVTFNVNPTSNAISLNIAGNTVTYSGSPAATSVIEAAEFMMDEINADANVNSLVVASRPEPFGQSIIYIDAINGSYNFDYTNLATAYSLDTKIGVSKLSLANTTGPITLDIGEADQIVQSAVNLQSASNTTQGILGRAAETDEEFRARRRNSLSIIGSGTMDSIIDNVANIEGVVRANGVENTTTSTDGAGRPGKSFEIIVDGGEDQEIAETIWDLKPAGIETYGLINGGAGITVVDGSGNDQQVEFSRPVERAMSVLIEYQLYPEENAPTNIQTAIDTAVLAYAATLLSGKDIIPQRFGNAVWNGVGGLQIVNAYVKVSADATSPAAPNTGVDFAVVPLDERDYGSLDQVDITYAVV